VNPTNLPFPTMTGKTKGDRHVLQRSIVAQSGNSPFGSWSCSWPLLGLRGRGLANGLGFGLAIAWLKAMDNGRRSVQSGEVLFSSLPSWMPPPMPPTTPRPQPPRFWPDGVRGERGQTHPVRPEIAASGFLFATLYTDYFLTTETFNRVRCSVP
jgi:hypothetical protein